MTVQNEVSNEIIKSMYNIGDSTAIQSDIPMIGILIIASVMIILLTVKKETNND